MTEIMLLQYDAFLGEPNNDDDYIIKYDEYGDCVFSGYTMEERNSPDFLTVRVQISDLATTEDAIRQLTKIIEYIDQDDIFRGIN